MPSFPSRRQAAASLCAAVAFLLATVASPAHATETVDEVIASLQAHGYASAELALERLQQATKAAHPTLAQRWRLDQLLSEFGLYAGDRDAWEASTGRLKAMAEHEHCVPCADVLAIRREQLAEGGEPAALRKSLAELRARPAPADPALLFAWTLAKANGLIALGDNDEGIAEALKAAEIATAHDLPVGLIDALAVLTNVDSARRDIPHALEYAHRGLARAREIGYQQGVATLLVDISYALSTKKENIERQAVLLELLQVSDGVRGMEPMHQVALINLAALCNDTHRYREAADYALRAERESNRDDNPNGYGFALVDRGVALVHLGQVDQGLSLVKTAVEIGEKTGEKRELADLLEQQVDALETAGRAAAALQVMHRWAAMDKEATASQRDKEVTKLQETFASRQRAQEIDRLKQDNARRDVELQLRAWRERAWAAAAVMVALLAVIVWQRLARTRHLNRGLQDDVTRLSHETHRDPLTQASNRRYGEALLQRLDREDSHLTPVERRHVALLLLDVDHFKRVNDTHGHAAGDAVLVEMTHRLKSLLREGDSVVRWGGEEFLLVLPGIDEAGLPAVAARLLEAVGAQPMPLPDAAPLPVRASAGAVSWRAGAGQPWPEALAEADAALYRAKAAGRNRAVLAHLDDAVDGIPLPA